MVNDASAYRYSSVVHTESADRLNHEELFKTAVNFMQQHEHGHEYHHAMPLGVMICVNCGKYKNIQVNRVLHNAAPRTRPRIVHVHP